MKTTTKVMALAGGAALLVLAAVLITVPVATDAAAPVCYQYASKSCISNISYWYDSCGNIQAVNQNCNTTNQMCSNGACVNKPGVNYGTGTSSSTGNTTQTGSYIQNYRTMCANNHIYWFDSRGTMQGVYQNCQDANSCTLDSCMDNACKIQLKCDGSTCAVNSADYITYCQANVQGQAAVNTGTTGTTATTNTTGQTTVSGGQVVNSPIQQGVGLAVSLFGKKQANDTKWTKSIDTKNNDKAEFLLVVKNTTPMQMDNVLAATDIGNSISYTGNLYVDGTAAAGNIVTGIDLGSIPANTAKVVQFTGTVQQQNAQVVQVVGRATAGSAADSDFFTVNIAASSATASVSGSPFIQFVKKWYLWIIIVLVLIALFVIIFRRLSTNP